MIRDRHKVLRGDGHYGRKIAGTVCCLIVNRSSMCGRATESLSYRGNGSLSPLLQKNADVLVHSESYRGR